MAEFLIQYNCSANAAKAVREFKQVYQFALGKAIAKCIIEQDQVEHAKNILRHSRGFVKFY